MDICKCDCERLVGNKGGDIAAKTSDDTLRVSDAQLKQIYVRHKIVARERGQNKNMSPNKNIIIYSMGHPLRCQWDKREATGQQRSELSFLHGPLQCYQTVLEKRMSENAWADIVSAARLGYGALP